ncbi:hypothetical protein MVEN_01098200 [Mycena venus]|uniref:Uncharacterized protein n=1 Tax=Mycena venus TaxID=2733690 RepID=A0A8H6Y4N2_9AGAR|nr:hypothetical protein MVEN_01098200 [Mycena venus]
MRNCYGCSQALHAFPASLSMPSSQRKDILQVISIHKVPSHLSKEDFEAKYVALLDEFLLMPQFERNLLKLEIMFQNDRFDEHLGSYGVPPREPVLVATAELESFDNLLAILSDTEVQQKIKHAEDFGLQSGASAFSIDVESKIERDSPLSVGDRVHIMAIYKVPGGMSTEQYGKGHGTFLEDYAAIPAVQNNLVKLEKWTQNNALDEHLHMVGYSRPEPTFIIHGELETWKNVVEFQDAESRKVALTANENFGLYTQACVFTADVVTKLDKSKAV